MLNLFLFLVCDFWFTTNHYSTMPPLNMLIMLLFPGPIMFLYIRGDSNIKQRPDTSTLKQAWHTITRIPVQKHNKTHRYGNAEALKLQDF